MNINAIAWSSDSLVLQTKNELITFNQVCIKWANERKSKRRTALSEWEYAKKIKKNKYDVESERERIAYFVLPNRSTRFQVVENVFIFVWKNCRAMRSDLSVLFVVAIFLFSFSFVYVHRMYVYMYDCFLVI